MRRDLMILFDWSLRGLSPAHDERWFAVPKWLMSVPISAINDVADLTFSYKKRKTSGNDICFLFRLAYNSGFLCKFAMSCYDLYLF